MDFGILGTSSVDPRSAVSVDDILRDALANTTNTIYNFGDVAKAGMNAYNAMSNFMNGNPNPTMMNSCYSGYQNPTPQYAYAETGMNYGNMSYINPVQNPTMGYPGFADPTYGMASQPGYFGR